MDAVQKRNKEANLETKRLPSAYSFSLYLFLRNCLRLLFCLVSAEFEKIDAVSNPELQPGNSCPKTQLQKLQELTDYCCMFYHVCLTHTEKSQDQVVV